MHFTSFLLGRGEQYERLDHVSDVQGDGSGEGIELYAPSEGISKAHGDGLLCEPGGNDREFLLFKTQEDGLLRDGPDSSQNQKAMVPALANSGTEHFNATMTLVIRKMDDTSFEVELSKGAVLLDLKEAIEKKFQDEGSQVSCIADKWMDWKVCVANKPWYKAYAVIQLKKSPILSRPHVWGYFCLSFRDQKLLEDQISLHQQLGIVHSDELAFVRHVDTTTSRDGQPWGFFTSLRKKHKLTS